MMNILRTLLLIALVASGSAAQDYHYAINGRAQVAGFSGLGWADGATTTGARLEVMHPKHGIAGIILDYGTGEKIIGGEGHSAATGGYALFALKRVAGKSWFTGLGYREDYYSSRISKRSDRVEAVTAWRSDDGGWEAWYSAGIVDSEGGESSKRYRAEITRYRPIRAKHWRVFYGGSVSYVRFDQAGEREQGWAAGLFAGVRFEWGDRE